MWFSGYSAEDVSELVKLADAAAGALRMEYDF
jgi:hypothetical protein